MDEFDILQIVGEGWFGKILLVEHKATDTEMVLKGIFMYTIHCEASFFESLALTSHLMMMMLFECRCTHCSLFSALPKPYVSIQDFYREFHLGLCLGVHKNIVSTYDVAFETSGFYVFTQEYAPLGKNLAR